MSELPPELILQCLKRALPLCDRPGDLLLVGRPFASPLASECDLLLGDDTDLRRLARALTTLHLGHTLRLGVPVLAGGRSFECTAVRGDGHTYVTLCIECRDCPDDAPTREALTYTAWRCLRALALPCGPDGTLRLLALSHLEFQIAPDRLGLHNVFFWGEGGCPCARPPRCFVSATPAPVSVRPAGWNLPLTYPVLTSEEGERLVARVLEDRQHWRRTSEWLLRTHLVGRVVLSTTSLLLMLVGSLVRGSSSWRSFFEIILRGPPSFCCLERAKLVVDTIDAGMMIVGNLTGLDKEGWHTVLTFSVRRIMSLVGNLTGLHTEGSYTILTWSVHLIMSLAARGSPR